MIKSKFKYQSWQPTHGHPSNIISEVDVQQYKKEHKYYLKLLDWTQTDKNFKNLASDAPGLMKHLNDFGDDMLNKINTFDQ